jgi:hypothetical protein
VNIKHHRGGHLWNATHYYGMWYATRNFGASTTMSNFPMTHRLSSDMKALHVKGIIVDHVAVVSDEFPHYALEKQARWHENVREMLTKWRVCAQKCLDAGFEESIIDVLFAATNYAKELADKIDQTNKFEKFCLDSFLCLPTSAIIN